MNVFKEYGENGEPLTQYYSGACGETIAQQMFGFHDRKEYSYEGNIRTRGGLMYYEYDGLGNVMDITDCIGSQVMAYRYDAFGNLFTQMAAPYNAAGYTGKIYDAKASLMDYSARWYSPYYSRFMNQDTYEGNLSNPQTLNRYSYVENNPVNNVDPTGHMGITLSSDTSVAPIGGTINFSGTISGASQVDEIAVLVNDSSGQQVYSQIVNGNTYSFSETGNVATSDTYVAAVWDTLTGEMDNSNPVTVTWSNSGNSGTGSGSSGGTTGGNTGSGGDTGSSGSGGSTGSDGGSQGPTQQELVSWATTAQEQAAGQMPGDTVMSAASPSTGVVSQPLMPYCGGGDYYPSQQNNSALSSESIGDFSNQPTLQIGSRGSVVQALQIFLNAATGSNLSIDGILGTKTKSVVQTFQYEYGLNTDGIVGSNTWGAIQSYISAQENSYKLANLHALKEEAMYEQADSSSSPANTSLSLWQWLESPQGKKASVDTAKYTLINSFWSLLAVYGAKGFGGGGEDGTAIMGAEGTGYAENVANASRLKSQLTTEEAQSIFTNSGTLKPQVIAQSRVLIQGSKLGDQSVINSLTSDGSSINDWAKMSTPTFKSPSGDFQVHFYENLKTGEINYYGIKVKFN